MWHSIKINCCVFDGEPISWNTPFFPMIIIDTEVSLKIFVNLILTWFILCPTTILLGACYGGMIYFNRLVLGTILLVFVALTFLEILWSIKTAYGNKRGVSVERKYIYIPV